MQTFLPFPDFHKCAQVLDRQRLGKQRVECKQILIALTENRGWVNHPATKMWKDYEQALAIYMLHMTNEWQERGYKDTCAEWLMSTKTFMSIDELDSSFDVQMPSWLGDERLHKSHRIALLCKDYYHYCNFGWDEAEPIPLYYEYFWPTLSADYGGTGDGILRK